MKKILLYTFLILIFNSISFCESYASEKQPSNVYKVKEICVYNENNKPLYTVIKDGKYGIADTDGNLIIPAEYDKAERLANNTPSPYIKMFKDGKVTIFSLDGKVVINPVYDDIYSFGKDRLLVKNNGKTGIIDNRGNVIIPIDNDSPIYHLDGKHRLLTKDNKYFLYITENQNGEEEIVPLDFDKAEPLGGKTLLVVEKNGKKGVTNYNTGEIVIPIKFDNIKSFGKNGLIVEQNGKKGLYLTTGEELIEPKYKDIVSADYTLLLITSEEEENFILNFDKKIYVKISEADEILPKPQINSYHGKKYYFTVKKDDKYGIWEYDFENNTAKQTVEYLYDSIENTVNYLNYKKHKKYLYYVVEKEGKYGLVDGETGIQILDCVYDSVDRLEYTDILKLGQNGKYGMFKLKNYELAEPKFEDIRVGKLNIDDDLGKYIQVKRNGKWHYTKKMKIATHAIGKTGLVITGIALTPVFIPVVGLMAWGLYSSSVPKTKIPATIEVKE